MDDERQNRVSRMAWTASQTCRHIREKGTHHSDNMDRREKERTAADAG